MSYSVLRKLRTDFFFKSMRASVGNYANENGIDDVLVMYSVPNFITDVNMVFMGV